MRPSPPKPLPKSKGALWPDGPGALASGWAAARARPDRRAAVAAWAARQPLLPRAVLAAAAGALAAAASGAVLGDLALPAAARAARSWAPAGAGAGLAYAAAARALLDSRRSRRWAGGAAVGLGFLLGVLADAGSAASWVAALVIAPLMAGVGVAVAVPRASAAERAARDSGAA